MWGLGESSAAKEDIPAVHVWAFIFTSILPSVRDFGRRKPGHPSCTEQLPGPERLAAGHATALLEHKVPGSSPSLRLLPGGTVPWLPPLPWASVCGRWDGTEGITPCPIL